VAIDDFIGPATPPARAQAIWDQYARHVEALAGQGARLLLLPEKIAVLPPAQAALVQQRFQALARRTATWITLGIGVQDADGRRNLAWLFAPDGAAPISYQKQHLAPPERDFLAGGAFAVQPVAGQAMGLAICKDMHFASTGTGIWRGRGAGHAGTGLGFPARRLDGGAHDARARRGKWLCRAARGARGCADGQRCAWTRAGGAPQQRHAGQHLAGTPAGAQPVTVWAGWLAPLSGWLCVALAAVFLCLGRRAARRLTDGGTLCCNAP
jgi:apolipoprotein N-acyltransferase